VSWGILRSRFSFDVSTLTERLYLETMEVLRVSSKKASHFFGYVLAANVAQTFLKSISIVDRHRIGRTGSCIQNQASGHIAPLLGHESLLFFMKRSFGA